MSVFEYANELECISFNNVVGLFESSVNPTVGGGFAGPSGSVLIRHEGATELWQKQSETDTDWIRIATGNDITSLSGAIDILSGDITYLSGAININTGDIISISAQIPSGGAIEVLDDLGDVDTTTAAPIIGDFLRYDGVDFIPSSSPTLSALPLSNTLAYGYDTTLQQLQTTNVFQIVTFNNTIVLEGWTYSAGVFTAVSGGAYMATFEFNVEKNGGGNVQCAVKANKNSTEVPGSHNGMDVTSNNTAFSVSRTFLLISKPGDTLNFLFSGNNTSLRILPAPTPGGITTSIGASLLIRRIV